MNEDFCIVDYPCEWCGGKVKIVQLPQEDKRVYLSLYLCMDCGKMQIWSAAFTKDFPKDEIQKMMDKFVEKYGA